MIENIGDTDRLVRFVVGAALILAALGGRVGLFWLLVGVVVVATAYKRFCPAYKFMNYNTLPKT